MRSKGFADNTSDLVEGGKVKFVCRVVPLSEHEEEPAEKLLDKGGFNPFGNKKKKEEEAEIERKNAAYKCEDDAATMPLKDFKKLQRLIGGGSKALLPQSVIVRAFVVRGKNIRPLDPSGLCDPYMKVDLLGTGKRFGNRRDHVKETLAPWFYKMFQLPPSSRVRPSQFKLYDWDKNGGDDVIGVNTVDLEDRWFSPIWKSQFSETPPLELRTLLNNDATGSQGSLELWVEMYEADENVPRAMKIAPPPVIDVELRVVIWRARKMVIKDIGGNNDLFFKVGLVGLDHKQTRFGQVQETDTHYFASDGKGSFNYRIIYRFSIPVTKAKLRVSAYDRDLIGSNDNIGEAILPLSGMRNDLMRVIQAAPDGELGQREVKMDATLLPCPRTVSQLRLRQLLFLDEFTRSTAARGTGARITPSRTTGSRARLRPDASPQGEAGWKGEGSAQQGPRAPGADPSEAQPVRPDRLAHHDHGTQHGQEHNPCAVHLGVPRGVLFARGVHHQRRAVGVH